MGGTNGRVIGVPAWLLGWLLFLFTSQAGGQGLKKSGEARASMAAASERKKLRKSGTGTAAVGGINGRALQEAGNGTRRRHARPERLKIAAHGAVPA